jgi:hypothetical protein
MVYTAADVEMANRHVAQGERHIVQQEGIISRLLLRGLPTGEAEDMLEELRVTLTQHRDHRTIMVSSRGGEA